MAWCRHHHELSWTCVYDERAARALSHVRWKDVRYAGTDSSKVEEKGFGGGYLDSYRAGVDCSSVVVVEGLGPWN